MNDIMACKGEWSLPMKTGDTLAINVQCDKRESCQHYLAHLGHLVSSRIVTGGTQYLDAEECADLEHEYYQMQNQTVENAETIQTTHGIMPKVIGKVVYKDITYNILPFTDAHTHIEPCWDCAFGGRCSLGMKEIIVKGEKKQVRENGFTCKRPADFPQSCTCINREDGRNVYFVRAMKPRAKAVERFDKEKFAYKNIILKVVAGNPDDCKGCYFLNKKCDCKRSIADIAIVGQCEAKYRTDDKDVVFKVMKQNVMQKGGKK